VSNRASMQISIYQSILSIIPKISKRTIITRMMNHLTMMKCISIPAEEMIRNKKERIDKENK
jgi:hypothetical protein